MDEKMNDLEINLLLKAMEKGEFSKEELNALSNSANDQIAREAKFLLKSPKELFEIVFSADNYERSTLHNKELPSEFESVEEMILEANKAVRRLRKHSSDVRKGRRMLGFNNGSDHCFDEEEVLYIGAFNSEPRIVASYGAKTEMPIDVIRYLVNSSNEIVRAGVAGNIMLPKDCIKTLSCDRCGLVLSALMCNPSTPGKLMDTMSHSKYIMDKHIAAGSPKVSVDTLVRLLYDENIDVSMAALKNANLPYAELLKISKSECPKEIAEVAQRLIQKDVRKKQRKLLKKAVISAIKNDLLTKEELESLIDLNLNDQETNFVDEVIKNCLIWTKTNEELFDTIVNDKELLKSVVTDKDATCEYLIRIKNLLSHYDGDEQYQLACDDETPRELFFALVFSNEFGVKEGLCGNKNLDKKILDYFCGYTDHLRGLDDFTVQIMVAEHENTSTETLSKLFMMYWYDKDILTALVGNKNLSADIMSTIEEEGRIVVQKAIK